MDGRMGRETHASVNGVVNGVMNGVMGDTAKSVKKSEASKDGRPWTFLP